jgi:hypothetical protein
MSYTRKFSTIWSILLLLVIHFFYCGWRSSDLSHGRTATDLRILHIEDQIYGIMKFRHILWHNTRFIGEFSKCVVLVLWFRKVVSTSDHFKIRSFICEPRPQAPKFHTSFRSRNSCDLIYCTVYMTNVLIVANEKRHHHSYSMSKSGNRIPSLRLYHVEWRYLE